MTQIIKCTCQHSYQDEKYGKGNRLANNMRTGQYRCTVCGAITGVKAGISQSDTVAAKIAAKESSKKTEPKPKVKEKDNKGKEKKKKSSLKGGKR